MVINRHGAKAKLLARIIAKTQRRATRKRLVRYGLLVFYVGLLGGTVMFVWPSTSNSASSTSNQSVGLIPSAKALPSDPLDQLSSVDIALQVAQLDSMPEVIPVKDQVESQQAELAMLSVSSDVAAKSQVVATDFISNKDIKTYVAQPGDTVSGVAAKFNITSDSITWSNNLSGQSLTAGQKLLIPPISGIVYIVKAGDTASSLAETYNAREDQIIAYNDAELNGITTGERIIIPNGQEPTPVAAVVVSNFTAIFGGNGYDYGYCTWYVASQIAVPNNWGNAITWAYYARLSGWTVSPVPIIGAIAQTPYEGGGEGHVAIVDNVETVNGQTMIEYRDMNGIAGWGRVGYSGWVPASMFPNYIYH